MGAAVRKVPVEKTEVRHNLAGQKLGRKGLLTRERILAATIELLNEGGETPLSLSAVARRVELGMTSLYLYFADLSELLLAVLEPVVAEADESVLPLINEVWPDECIEERATRFLEAYFDYWERHTRILHLRNTMADQYDERMMDSRVQSAIPMLDALRRQLAGSGKDVTPLISGMASVLVTGIERNINLVTDRGRPSRLGSGYSPRKQSVVESSAALITFAARDCRGL